MYEPSKVTTLYGRKHEQNLRVVVTILITNAVKASMQHGDPHCGDLIQMLLHYFTGVSYLHEISSKPFLLITI